MSHCPKLPPSSWKDVLKEVIENLKLDPEYKILAVMIFFLIGVWFFIKIVSPSSY